MNGSKGKKYILENIKLDSTILSRIPLVEEKIINEIAHSFSKQYELAKKCTYEVMEMLKFDEKHRNIDVSEFGNETFQNIELTIDKNGYSSNVRGRIEGITSDFTTKLIVFVGNSYLVYGTDVLESLVFSAISHELSHSNVYYQRYFNNCNINDCPDYYEKAVEIMHSSETFSVEYCFSYGLYSTYYQEVQAFISQTWPEFEKEIKKSGRDLQCLKKKEFVAFFQRTNTYLAFIENIKNAEFFIGNKKELVKLSRILTEKGLPFSYIEIENEWKRIENTSKKALKKAINNCYVFFMENGGEIK